MLTDFFEKYKKQCIWAAVALGVILLILYLHAILRPGLWYRDTFLYQQKDGAFDGSRGSVHYRMEISPMDGGKEILFSVNDQQRRYQIHTAPENARIFEDGVPVFSGKVLNPDLGILEDENGELVGFGVTVTFSNALPEISDLFPSLSQLYQWAVGENHEHRGQPVVLLCVAVLAIILAVDIIFPDFFYFLRHGLEVDGGEPSDIYRFNQKIGRGAMAVGILIFLALGFTGP